MNVSRGRYFENKVKEYIKNKGFVIISSNFYSPFGEIDIIAEKESKVHFIEVKYLFKSSKINPILKIDMGKIRRIFLSIAYLKKFCRIKKYQVDSYSVYYKKGVLNFEYFPDLRLQ